LESALSALDTQPEDAAAVELAREYAIVIDTDKDSLWRIGPRFLDVLASLGMTPKARADFMADEEPEAQPESPLDELRARRAQREASQ
ncbi:MAG: hypothetical protein VW362_09580, partial [Candidatus Nanopelagicales bacterium]